MAIEKVKVVKLDTKPANNSLKELRDQLKEAKAAMLSAEEGTDEYNAALTRAADASHQLKEQQERIRGAAADAGQVFKNVTSIVGGVVGAYQAAQAAMNLMGVENEAVIESMKKMQDLMALTQAFTPIKQGVDAFKDLKNAIAAATGATSKFGRALVATGLGALVALLGYAVTHLDEISGWLDEITGQTDVLGTAIAAVQAAFSTAGTVIIGGLKLIGTAIKNHVTAPFKGVMAAITAYTDTNGNFGAKIKAAAKAMKDSFVNSYKEIGDEAKELGEEISTTFTGAFEENKLSRKQQLQKKATEEYLANLKKETDEYKAALNDRYNAAQLQMMKERMLREEQELWQARLNKKKAEEEAAYYDKQLEAVKQRIQGMDDATARSSGLYTALYQYREALLKAQQDVEKWTASVKSAQDALVAINPAIKVTNEEISEMVSQLDKLHPTMKTVQEVLDEAIAKMNNSDVFKDYRLAASAYEEYVNSVVENARRMAFEQGLAYDADLAALKKAYEQKKITQQEYVRYSEMLNKQHHVSEMQAWTATMSNIGDIMNSIGSMVDQSTEEGKQRYKGIMTTSIIMSTLAGIAGAITSAFMPVNSGISIFGQIAMAATTSASVLASGIAQLVQLHKVDENSSLGSLTNTTPSLSGGLGSVVAPVQYTRDVQGAEIEGALSDQRVYVLESDISGTQNKVSVAEGEARY